MPSSLKKATAAILDEVVCSQIARVTRKKKLPETSKAKIRAAVRLKA